MNLKIETVIAYLYSNKEPTSIIYLAYALGVHQKTLMNVLNSTHKSYYDKLGVQLTIHNKMIHFKIVDRSKANELQFVINLAYNPIMPYVPDENRVHYIIKRLLSSDTPVSLDEFSETLCVSNSSITNDLKAVSQYIDNFNLTLDTVYGEGLIIKGNEQFIRNMLLSEYKYLISDKTDIHYCGSFNQLFELNNSQLENKLDCILKDALEQFNNFIIVQEGYLRIKLALIITLNRRNYQNFSYKNENIHTASFSNSILIVDYILTNLIEVAGFDASAFDRTFLIILFNSFRNFNSFLEINDKKHYYNSVEMSTEIIKEVASKTGIVEFITDSQLKENLTFHLVSAVCRYEHRVFLDYIPTYLITRNSFISLEIGIIASYFLKNKYNYKINPKEAAYLSLHFLCALYNIQDESNHNLNIGVVTSVSRDVAYSILRKDLNSLHWYSANFTIYEKHQIEHININQYDIILSDLSKEHFKTIDIPLYSYDFLENPNKNYCIFNLYHNNYHKMDIFNSLFKEKYFFSGLIATTKNNCLLEMANSLSERTQVDSNFIYEELVKREQMCTVEQLYGSAFMMIESPIGKESFCSIFILNKPIIWFREKVQQIYVLNLVEKDKKKFLAFMGDFERILNSIESVVSITKEASYNYFMLILEQYVMNDPIV